MTIVVLKWLFLSLIISAVFLVGCVNPGDRDGRINIYDVNGDYWFPPQVTIMNDTLNVLFSDPVSITSSIKVINGPPRYLVWSSLPSSIFDSTELLDTLTDSTVSGDTVTYFHQSKFTISKEDTVNLIVKAIDVNTIESIISDTVVVIFQDSIKSF